MVQARETYTLAVDADGMTIVRDVWAGVSGPVAEAPLPGDFNELLTWLGEKGFEPAGPTTYVKKYNGLGLSIPLVRK